VRISISPSSTRSSSKKPAKTSTRWSRCCSISTSAADDEELNAIFRCAHSIKGGAATFGFSDVAELTHQMETLLDKLRRHELGLIPPMVDVLLESADASRSLLARHQAGGEGAQARCPRLPQRRPAPAPVAAAPAPVAAAPVAAPAPKSADGSRVLEIRIGPLEKPEQADALQELFRDIPGLGTMKALPSESADTRVYEVHTSSTDGDLLDLFIFHVSKEQVSIKDLAEAAAPATADDASAAAAGPVTSVDEEDFGFFAGAPGVPPEEAPARVAAPVAVEGRPADQPGGRTRHHPGHAGAEQPGPGRPCTSSCVRPGRPGAQHARPAGIGDVDPHDPDVEVFNRFPRMLRDLAAQAGQEGRAAHVGEATELDKGLVEKITDPLTHLVRNSCDHGIELPADRLAAGQARSTARSR
jgi:two-component system chemotaxis sensor kinase CheA